VKLKTFSEAKDTLIQTEWQNSFTNSISDTGLIPRTRCQKTNKQTKKPKKKQRNNKKKQINQSEN
ncbi:hypothetical protein ACQP3J_31995, partial [Escherichia coli]